MLAVVADLGGIAWLALTAVDFQLSGENLDECRFSCAVWTNKHYAVATFDGKIEVFINPFFTVGLADFIKLNHFLVRTWRLRETEFERFARRAGFLDAD